jgi:hypothetical protein
MKSLLPVTIVVLVCATEALGATGDPRAIQGRLEWPASLATAQRFVVLRADDGQDYYVELTSVQRPGSGAGTAGSRISVTGVEGLRPFEITATAIAVGDSAAVAPVPAASEVTAASPPSTSAGPAPGAAADVAAPGTASSQPLWQLEGKVVEVTSTSMVLDTRKGERVNVEVANLSGWTRQTVGPGDEVKLFGVARGDQRLVANGFIYLVPPAGSASPQTTR